MASISSNHGREAGSKLVQRQVVDNYATLGQLSMAPATQTTVITTTTTTTMSYPPFVMNAPRNLSERDSKEYPLAHTQAPESIRRFFFDAGGTQACFEEANDVVDKMQQVRLTGLGLFLTWSRCGSERETVKILRTY
jgi:F-box and WD-40 domain protein CDC4